MFFFFFYAHTFFPRKYIPLVSLLLAPESWAGGAMQGEKAVPWWVEGYEAFWAAPGSHGLLRDTVHGFQENTGGETLGIGRNCRKSSLAQWVSCEVQTLPTTWNLALAGTQVANMNSRSSAGLYSPKISLAWKTEWKIDPSEFQLAKLEDVQKQRNNVFV